jgi:hypothetical protein
MDSRRWKHHLNFVKSSTDLGSDSSLWGSCSHLPKWEPQRLETEHISDHAIHTSGEYVTFVIFVIKTWALTDVRHTKMKLYYSQSDIYFPKWSIDFTSLVVIGWINWNIQMLVTISRVCYKQCSLFENKHVFKGLIKRELTGCCSVHSENSHTIWTRAQSWWESMTIGGQTQVKVATPILIWPERNCHCPSKHALTFCEAGDEEGSGLPHSPLIIRGETFLVKK